MLTSRFARFGAFFIVLLTTALPSFALEPVDTNGLTAALDTLIENHPAYKRTTIYLKVVDLETGEVLYGRGGDKLLVPASNLKIYTASTAFDLLGADYQWSTSVSSTKPIKRGVCQGDLIIHGTGDPMLDTEQLASLADDLIKQNKLKRVQGNVYVAISPRWEHVPLKGTGWMWDDDPDYYNMSIRSVMLNYNTLEVVVKHGKDKPIVTLVPATDWPKIEIDEAAQDDPTKVRITRKPFDETIHISGNPPADAEPVQETITMHDPALWIAAVFKQMLIERGVKVNGDVVSTQSIPTDAVELVSHKGQTLTEAMRHFLRVSENAVGEMTLLKLAETQTEDDVSWPAGAKVITDWLVNTAGLEPDSFYIVDGSGLSRYNRISADSSVKLLTFMKKHKHFEPFFDGLNEYEVPFPEGEKWDGVPLAEFDNERVFAKSGGMRSVATLSGYVKTLDGRWLAFSFLTNGYYGSNKPVFDLRSKVWTELIRYRPAEVAAEMN